MINKQYFPGCQVRWTVGGVGNTRVGKSDSVGSIPGILIEVKKRISSAKLRTYTHTTRGMYTPPPNKQNNNNNKQWYFPGWKLPSVLQQMNG